MLGPYPGYQQGMSSLEPFTSLPTKTVGKNYFQSPFVPRSVEMSKSQKWKTEKIRYVFDRNCKVKFLMILSICFEMFNIFKPKFIQY